MKQWSLAREHRLFPQTRLAEIRIGRCLYWRTQITVCFRKRASTKFITQASHCRCQLVQASAKLVQASAS